MPAEKVYPNGLTIRGAVRRQEALRDRVVRRPTFRTLRLVAGVDLSHREERSKAAIVTLTWPDLEFVECAAAVRPMEFPYVPGLLGFREVPAALDAFAKLKRRPDLLIVDGQGLAHPRRFGVACHLGVELDVPSVGCAKSRLIGTHREPATRKGSRTALKHDGETIGAVVRTRDGVRPVYVSIGHRTDLSTAVRIVLRACTKYRLPEPVREADRAAGRL